MRNYRDLLDRIRRESSVSGKEDVEILYNSFVVDVLNYMDNNLEEYVEKYPLIKNMLVSLDKKYDHFHHLFSERMNREKHMDLKLSTTTDMLWVELI